MKHSIVVRILMIIGGVFFVVGGVLLLASHLQLTFIIETSQRVIYEQKLNTVINVLASKAERLAATGNPEAYQEAFQRSVVKELSRTRYSSAEQQVALFIVDDDDKVVLRPTVDLVLPGSSYLQKMITLKNGEFNKVDEVTGKERWTLVRAFPDWGWIIGFSVPHSVRYADVSQFRKRLILTLALVLVSALIGLSIVVMRVTRPIIALTRASGAMARGDLEHFVDTSGTDELASLSKSFVQMRDVIREELAEQQARMARIQSQQDAISGLAASGLMLSGDCHQMAREITETIAGTMQVARASVWLFDGDYILRCVDLFEAPAGRHTEGMQLALGDFPKYLAAINERLPIAADDALNDPRTRELAASYLVPHQITSMLDTVIYVAGESVGIICLEHTGEQRNWQSDEVAFVTAITDQTAQSLINCQRIEAEKELDLVRNMLSNIVNSMPSMLVGVDGAGKIIQWNQEAVKVTGLAAHQVEGQSFVEVLPRFEKEMDQIYTAIRSREVQIETRVVKQGDGETQYYDIAIYPLLANGVEGAVIRVDDVTERVQIEEMMVQSEKMLSVGGLAAGMAHEINNPLAGIMQTAEVLARRLARDLPANERAATEAGTTMTSIRTFLDARDIPRMVERIHEAGNRISGIVSNMLNFARKGSVEVTSYNLAELLDRSIELAGSDYDLKKKYDFRKIEIVRDYETDLPLVPCEGGTIQQVMLNILRNGAEAMQENQAGRMHCFTLRIRNESAAGMVCIEIADNGPGMDEETCKRIFEPFFTTKPVGLGTGLGLSVSYFIVVENHGGEMSVESQAGQGTKFIIRLPVEV